MKPIWKKGLSLFLLGCVFITGCTTPGTSNPQGEAVSDNPNKVYRVYPSSRTTNEWENAYGVISYDGRMIIPIDNHEVNIIEDSITGEQVWIQIVTRYVDDPNLSAEDLWIDNNWEKVHNNYLLYDLDGNLVKDLGENGISTVYDNLVLYYNGQLADRETGKVYFDDVNAILFDGERYFMNVDYYNRARVTDTDLNILYETEGSIYNHNDTYYINAVKESEDGRKLRGLQTWDGTQIIPCRHNYFSSHYASDVPYIIGNDNGTETVYSIEDGSVIYQETGEHTDYNYIQYLFEDYMIMQKREVVATAENGGWPIYRYTTQFYTYDGTPFGEEYQNLSPYTSIKKKNAENGNSAELLFNATTIDGDELIINQEGKTVYDIPDYGWVTLVDRERIIFHNPGDDTAILYDIENNRLNEKAYQYMHVLYIDSSNGMGSVNSKLLNASYTIAGKILYDLIDRDGNVVIERCKSIQGLSEDRFWVEKGFSQGLMDAKGNWILELSVFDSTIDE